MANTHELSEQIRVATGADRVEITEVSDGRNMVAVEAFKGPHRSGKANVAEALIAAASFDFTAYVSPMLKQRLEAVEKQQRQA